mmetsp:Transcript_3105/g.4699  ORF Transcript_3105/g.4699 Transcript_3105/m.4699 type:complete len:364 (-) Transcript_3105:287-1378(-)|eukprot:CAMPEP_0194214802 /NCGR_PEP_ID=MMETSP0156-20130528/16178_1 /TAXON_ID=33649 /ORGANISM="Thalassionema nitzschioides, Strain L26-B" /LENGTH=363 /DNA_ID=CAMNT_0038943145 /DNA_START=78 /DNA_END=1169 /DNA_ORIENTATION=-
MKPSLAFVIGLSGNSPHSRSCVLMGDVFSPVPRRVIPSYKGERCFAKLYGTAGDTTDEYESDTDEEDFLLEQLAYIESIEDDLEDLEKDIALEEDYNTDEDFSDLFESDEYPKDKDLVNLEDELIPESARTLEDALLQGVVPAGAGVGSESLPGDFGFDPLNLATKDYIGSAQTFIQSLIPGGEDLQEEQYVERPKALILRDYREAEIRHGRLAMLAAIFWPLQEMLDRLLLDENQFGSIVYAGVTLPYIPLLMTAIMMLLGYLDIYSRTIKDVDKIGEAFLPGDCFWDPLSMLAGAPDRMKKNMQERELFNGRMAMLAVVVYFWEELTSHQPIISIEGNELLFEPAYEIPVIQSWLDSIFAR